MEQKIKALITKLSNENNDRSIVMNDGQCSEYAHTVLVHKYNNTLDIIKQLEEIVN
tara:strand:+ start:124 stop:291 length:168 start_codon:yes stop_codon:yes gene_type:complete